MSEAWYWWRIIWALARNIIYILLVLTAFDKVSTTFENIVLCLLLLILQSVTWAHTTQTRLLIEEAFSNKRVFFLLLKRDAEKMMLEDVEEAEEQVNEATKKYKDETSFFYINAVGALIVYLFVLWKIFAILA
jgi:hypothetical protein